MNRRRRLVTFARNAPTGSAPVEPNKPATSLAGLEEFLEAASETLTSLIPRANHAIDSVGEVGFAEFAEVVQRIARLSDDARLATRYRPFRALRDPLVRVGISLGEFVDAVSNAMCVGSPGEAQHSGRQVQPAIDRATEAVDIARARIDDWGYIEDSERPLDALIEVASRRAGNDGLVGMAGYGVARIAEHFGDLDFEMEHGVLGSLLSAQADVLFDAERFWSLARRVFDSLVGQPARLEALVNEPGWQARWSKSMSDAYWASERSMASMKLAVHDENVVESFLSVCHALQEGMTKTAFASVRFVSNPNQSFEALLASGVGSLGEWGIANDYPEAAALLVPSRNAHAHNDWQIEGDHVVLCALKPPAGGTVSLDSEQLVDHALEVQELTIAVFLGITIAGSVVGVQFPSADRLTGASSQATAAALLAASGWREVALEESSDFERVTVSCERDGPGSITDFVTLTELFPQATKLEVQATTMNGQRDAVIDLEASRMWAAESTEDLKTLAFAQLLHMVSVDAAPVASTSEVRRIVCGVTARWVIERDDERGVVAVFRKARQVAKACADDELSSVVKVAQGWRRTNLRGGQRSVDELSSFTAWMNLEPSLNAAL